MDSAALDAILNDTAPAASVDTGADTTVDTGSSSVGFEQETAVPPKAPAPIDEVTDPDLKWDEEDDTGAGEPEDKAPDQQDDDELAKIEEKNKWMKGRLAPVKDKLSRAEQEVAALRAENEALKSGRPAQQAPVQEAQDLESYVNQQPVIVELNSRLAELDKQADSLTEKQYIDIKLELLSELKLQKRDIVGAVQNHYAQQHQQIAKTEEKIFSDYTSTVLAAKEEYPDIDKALDRLNKNAGNLDLEIRRSLIFEGDKINPIAADLVNIIGNDKKAMGYLIAQTKLAKQTGRVPTQAIEYIGRLKARIQSDKSSSMEAPDVGVSQRRSGMPKEVRTHSATEPVDLQAWAREAVKSGKRPW